MTSFCFEQGSSDYHLCESATKINSCKKQGLCIAHTLKVKAQKLQSLLVTIEIVGKDIALAFNFCTHSLSTLKVVISNYEPYNKMNTISSVMVHFICYHNLIRIMNLVGVKPNVLLEEQNQGKQSMYFHFCRHFASRISGSYMTCEAKVHGDFSRPYSREARQMFSLSIYHQCSHLYSSIVISLTTKIKEPKL